MSGSDSTASSSSIGCNCKVDDIHRIADLIVGGLAKTLALHLRDVVEVTFAAEAARWSTHLQSTLLVMEQESIKQLNVATPPNSLVACCRNHLVNMVHEEDERDENCSSCSATPTPSTNKGKTYAKHKQHNGSNTTQSRTHLKTRESASSNNSNPAGPSHCTSRSSVDELDSLEERLAKDMFAKKLGASSCMREPHSVFSEQRASTEPVLGTKHSSPVSSSSHSGDSREVRPAERVDMLFHAIGCESPALALGGEASVCRNSSLRSSPSCMSLGDAQERRWDMATRSFCGGQRMDVDVRESKRKRVLVNILPRLLGLLPWNPRYRYASLLYQVFIVLVASLATLDIAMEMRGRFGVENHDLLVGCLDAVLACGGVLGLCSCVIYNKAIVAATGLLEAYADRAGISKHWDKLAGKDVICAIVVFSTCLCLQFFRCWPTNKLALHCAIAFSELLLLGLCVHLLRMCRCLCVIVDMYSNNVLENEDFEDAAEEWCLLDAMCRTACKSYQLCFVVLQSAAMGALLFAFAAVDLWGKLESRVLSEIIRGLLCAMAVVYLSMCASSFTQSCNRAPTLVNSSTVAHLDAKRMHLVEYIAASKTGFYIFDLQLSPGIILKIFYVACAAAFSFSSSKALQVLDHH